MDIFQTITFAGIIGFLTLVVGILVKVIGLPDQIRKIIIVNRQKVCQQHLWF